LVLLDVDLNGLFFLLMLMLMLMLMLKLMLMLMLMLMMMLLLMLLQLQSGLLVLLDVRRLLTDNVLVVRLKRDSGKRLYVHPVAPRHRVIDASRPHKRNDRFVVVAGRRARRPRRQHPNVLLMLMLLQSLLLELRRRKRNELPV
jgi:hypothetical protein